MGDESAIDLLVVGAGPTGVAIGAEAKKSKLTTLLIDRGALLANLLDFPTFMKFFTTRDRLEVADVPFAIPEDKPDRRQAITYYHSVVRRYGLDLALYEEVENAVRQGEFFEVTSQQRGRECKRYCRALALATGYFHLPRTLGVPGEDLPWVYRRYEDPYRRFGERVVVIGGGNSAVEAALDLWRNGVHVTLVHRRETIKPSIKYWLKPDFEHRVEEGSIDVRYGCRVQAFVDGGVALESPDGAEILPAEAAYVLIGYLPDANLMKRLGIEVNPDTLIPTVEPATCESNVEGVYVAGTLQAGRRTDLIFIENSRDHGQRIARHLRQKLDSAGHG